MGRTTEVYSDVFVNDKMFEVEYLQAIQRDRQFWFVVNFKQNREPKSSENVMQEMVEAFFIGLDKIIQREKLPTTYAVKIDVNSREHFWVYGTFYTRTAHLKEEFMDKILEGLSDQLGSKEDLNIGLLMKITFYET